MRTDDFDERAARRRMDSSHSPRSSKGCFSSVFWLIVVAVVLTVIYYSGAGKLGR
jgi:hypothetical protein